MPWLEIFFSERRHVVYKDAINFYKMQKCKKQMLVLLSSKINIYSNCFKRILLQMASFY